MSTKRPHHRLKPVLMPETVITAGPIRHGLAVIAYDERANCWLLPDGPNQKNRKISNAQVAMQFAIRLNNILNTASNKYAHLINA